MLWKSNYMPCSLASKPDWGLCLRCRSGSVTPLSTRSKSTGFSGNSRPYSRSPLARREGGSTAARGRDDTDSNPFVTSQGSRPGGRSARQDEEADFWQRDTLVEKPPGPLVNDPAKAARAASPVLTRLLVATMLILFIYQWWPFLTNFHYQSSFITNATRGQTGPSSFLPALRTLTFGIPEPGNWPDLLVRFMLDRNRVLAGQWWRFYTTTLLHANLLHLLANVVAIHEFGRELEGHISKLQYLAVLISAAYASGVVMLYTGRPVGAEALLPVSGSGLVMGITGVLLLLSLFMKDLRQQGTLGSSATALVVAFLLGQFVPALDNGIHFGGLVGGLAMGVIILLWFGVRNLFRGRKTRAAGS